jgi:AraC family transcriptional regulator
MSSLLVPLSFSGPAIDAVTGFKSESLHDPTKHLLSGLRVVTAHVPLLPRREIFHMMAGWEEDVVSVQLKNTIPVEGKLGSRFKGYGHPGSCYIMPRGESSEWMFQGNFDIILFQLPAPLLSRTVLCSFDRDPGRVSLRPRTLQSDMLLYGIGQALLAELQRESDASSSLYVEVLQQALLVHVLRNYAELGAPPSMGSLSASRLRPVYEYVEAHLDAELRLAELAALAHLSPYHFARAFKQATSQSVHQYVVGRRLAAGRRLLETTTLSISDIARQVGFADHSHFGRAFKRAYGISPSSVARGRRR